MADKFKAVIDEPELLKESINALSTLLTEAVFKVTKSGLELRAMDAANVAMADMKLLASAFRTFEVEKDIEIALNLSDLTSILKRSKGTDSVTLELKDNQLLVEMKGGTKRSFNLPLLDIKQDQKIPSLDFPVSIKIKTEAIEDGISDAEIVGDAVILEADPDSFVMRAEGNNRKAEVRIEKGNDLLIELKAKDHVKSIFPLDYLKKFIKAAKLCKEATLHLGNEYPMKIDFKVLDKIQLSFILAPRIESE